MLFGKNKKKNKKAKILDIKIYMDSSNEKFADITFDPFIINRNRLTLETVSDFVNYVTKPIYK